MTDRQIESLVHRGIWRRLHDGVYLHGSADPTWRQSLRAATYAAGPGSCASHRAAATLYGLLSFTVIEVSVRYETGATIRSGTVYRRRRPFRRVRSIHGIRVTSVEQTLLDLASVVAIIDLEMAIETALLRRLTTEERLWRTLVTHGGRGVAGSTTFRKALANRPNGRPARSVLEVLTTRMLRRFRHIDFVRNFQVFDGDGRKREIDFAFERFRVALEVDGMAFHSTRAQSKSDQTRRRALEAAGWLVLRVGWHDVVVRPEWVIKQLESAFAGRHRELCR